MELQKVKESVDIFCADLRNDGIDSLQRGYFNSYYFFTDYFKEIAEYEAKHVIIGAGFTYSWMDRVLSWRINNAGSLDDAAKVLNGARDLSSIADVKNFDFKNLRNVVEGSYIGTSKLLHFVNPNVFPIYDSHICRYFNGDVKNHYVNTKMRFYGYVDEVSTLLNAAEFCDLVYKPIISVLISYNLREVSRIRALEMAIFHHQRRKKAINNAN